MGRGRAKAKQTKVARDLKYSSPSTDFDNLQRELSGHAPEPVRRPVAPPEPPDPYARYADEDWDDHRTG